MEIRGDHEIEWQIAAGWRHPSAPPRDFREIDIELADRARTRVWLNWRFNKTS